MEIILRLQASKEEQEVDGAFYNKYTKSVHTAAHITENCHVSQEKSPVNLKKKLCYTFDLESK